MWRRDKNATEARSAGTGLPGAAAAPGGTAGPAGGARNSIDDTEPIQRLPSGLLAAALSHGTKGAAVRLALNGGEIVAVTGGGGGDPNEWWATIHRLTSGSGAGHVPD